MLPLMHYVTTHTPAALNSPTVIFPTIVDMYHATPFPSSAGTSSLSSLSLFPATSSIATGIGSMSPVEVAASALSNYRSALDSNPLRVKIMTGCVLALIGDAIAQSRQSDSYDTKRAAAFVAFDGCWRAVQQLTYPPLIQACHGQYLLGILGTLPFFQAQNQDPLLYAAMEQTLVSQLVMIPCELVLG